MIIKRVWRQRRNSEANKDIGDNAGAERAGEPDESGNSRKRGDDGRSGDKKRMSDLDQATEIFIKAILSSEVYHTYLAELEKVKQNPDLKKEIDDFRWRNFDLQLSQDADYEKLDRFEKEYENFQEQPLVADFLAAELDLCRKMQGIGMRVIEALNFE